MNLSKTLKMIALALPMAFAVGTTTAPATKADGFYVGGTYTTGSQAYWDPACGCWVYPSYTYQPAYTYSYPAYYSYPRYSYPYYSRPRFSIGFSFGDRHFGGYGYRRWRR